MKKIFYSIFLVLLSFCVLISQNKKHPELFKYSKVKVPSDKFFGWESVMNNYVVIPSKGKANENYNKVLEFIKVTYSNPDKIIDIKEENKFIRINGFEENLYFQSSIPLSSESYDVRYILTIYIKENRIKLEVSSMEYSVKSTKYDDPDRLIGKKEYIEWFNLDKIYIHKANGNPKKRVFGKTDKLIEDYFNGIVNLFKQYDESIYQDSEW